ncbi:MAG: glycosyltransferase family 4 protein [Candidatus Methanomethylicaceae archaeon]
MICIIAPGSLEVPTYRGGGREEQNYSLGLYLSKYFRIIIISPFYGLYIKKTFVNSNFRIERVYFPSYKSYPSNFSLLGHILSILSMYFYSILASLKVIELARELKIVIITDVLTGFLPAVVAKLLGLKLLFSEGNITPWFDPCLLYIRRSPFKKIFSSFEKISGKIVIKLSDTVRAQLSIIKKGMVENGVNVSKIVVIGPGIDVNMFKPSYGAKEFKIGFIGRLSDEKGAPLLLKICETLQNKLPKNKFKILGDGPYMKCFKHLSNIEHIGWIKRSDIPAFLSDVNILLFFQKGLGVGEIEAMSMGKIIIAPNIGEIPSIIEHGKNGFLVAPKAEFYVNAIKKIVNLEAPSLEKISENARVKAVTSFSWKIIGEKWKSVIESLLEVGYKGGL